MLLLVLVLLLVLKKETCQCQNAAVAVVARYDGRRSHDRPAAFTQEPELQRGCV